MLGNAALAMAARMRLFRDTVVEMAGGDLIDMINEDQNSEENGYLLLPGDEEEE